MEDRDYFVVIAQSEVIRQVISPSYLHSSDVCHVACRESGLELDTAVVHLRWIVELRRDAVSQGVTAPLYVTLSRNCVLALSLSNVDHEIYPCYHIKSVIKNLGILTKCRLRKQSLKLDSQSISREVGRCM